MGVGSGIASYLIMVVVMMVMIMVMVERMNDVAVIMSVRMAFMAGTTEETTELVRREIGNHFGTLLEVELDALDIMRLHD